MGFLKRLLRLEKTAYCPFTEQIEAHVERFVGPCPTVFHELVSDAIHVDLHPIMATDERPYHFVHTTGMSALPMPGAATGEEFMEMGVFLDPQWDLSNLTEESFWPLGALKYWARLPVTNRTAVTAFMSIPSMPNPQVAYPGTNYWATMAVPPLLLPDQFAVCEVGNGKRVRFIAIMPLMKEELEFKLQFPEKERLWEEVLPKVKDWSDFLVIRKRRMPLPIVA